MKAVEFTFPDDHERFVITVYAFYPIGDFSIKDDKIRMGLSVLYFKGSQVILSKLLCISVHEDDFI